MIVPERNKAVKSTEEKPEHELLRSRRIKELAYPCGLLSVKALENNTTSPPINPANQTTWRLCLLL